MSYEAMNNAGSSKTKLIVILNDNDMSIAKPVGAMRAYLAKIFSGKFILVLEKHLNLLYQLFQKDLVKKPGKAEDFLRSAMTGGTLFNSMGFYYVGPIDGHDVDAFVSVIKNAKEINYDGPIMIHIKTEKGKGYNLLNNQKTNFMVYPNLM